MKSLLQWMVAWCMEAWIERRAEKRKKKDKFIVADFLSVATAKSNVLHEWKLAPQRLRGRIKREMRARLQEMAEEASCWLPNMVINAVQCGAVLTKSDTDQLFRTAMNNAYGCTQKLTFAKLMHGPTLPLDLVLNLLRETGECWQWIFNDRNTKDMELLLAEISCDNESQVSEFLSVIASKGRYRHLRAACKILDQQIPTTILRDCFEAAQHLERLDYWALTSMCIALQDWEKAKELIEQMEHEDKLRSLAGDLALAIFHSKSEATVS